jgi:hypothetical protein
LSEYSRPTGGEGIKYYNNWILSEYSRPTGGEGSKYLTLNLKTDRQILANNTVLFNYIEKQIHFLDAKFRKYSNSSSILFFIHQPYKKHKFKHDADGRDVPKHVLINDIEQDIIAALFFTYFSYAVYNVSRIFQLCCLSHISDLLPTISLVYFYL